MRWSCDLGPNRSEPVAVPMVLDTRPNGKCIENPCFQWIIDVNSMVSVDVPLFIYLSIDIIDIHTCIDLQSMGWGSLRTSGVQSKLRPLSGNCAGYISNQR